MKKYTFRFRSILINTVEKVIPGTVFSKMVLEMDDNTIEEHTIDLTIKDILADTTLITHFFLSFMITAPVTVILYYGMYFGFGRSMEPASWFNIKIIYFTAAVILFAIFWIFLAVRVSIENRKRDFILRKRGSGNWKLVKESDWDRFYRLLMIAKNQRESEKIIK